MMNDVNKTSVNVRYKIHIKSQCQYAKIRLHSLDNLCLKRKKFMGQIYFICLDHRHSKTTTVNKCVNK